MKRYLLCVLLLVLATAATGACAQPEIVSYQIHHGAAQCDFSQKVCVTVRASGDDYSGLGVEVKPPGADAFQPVAQCSGWDDATQAMVYRQAVSCGNSAMPAVGKYELRATDAGGQDTLTTGETTTFPTEPVQLTYPTPYQVVESANPVVTWLPYSFPGDPLGTPGAVVQQINPSMRYQGCDAAPLPGADMLDVMDWSVWVREPFWAYGCVQGPDAAAPSWQYDGGTCGSVTSLVPGAAYSVSVSLISTGHALDDRGWYYETVSSGYIPFAVAGAAPAFEEVRLNRGVSRYPNGRKVYGEWTAVLGSDSSGVENLRVSVSDPNGSFREEKGTLVDRFGDGLFTQGQMWAEVELGAALKAGTYVYTLRDKASGQKVTLTHPAEALPEPHVITSPANGAVLGQAPTFTWTAVDNRCASMVWVEEIPADVLGYDFVYVPFAQVLPSYADGRIIWQTCLPGDATSVTYEGEALQPGHKYRFHVMTESSNCGCLRKGAPIQAWDDLQALVDFTVR